MRSESYISPRAYEYTHSIRSSAISHTWDAAIGPEIECVISDNEDYIFIVFQNKYDQEWGYVGGVIVYKLWRYDLNNDIWIEKDINLKAHRYLFSCAIYEDSIYVFGGIYHASAVQDTDLEAEAAIVEKCDITDDEFIECDYIETMEQPRSIFHVTVVSERYAVLYGGTADGVEVFDLMDEVILRDLPYQTGSLNVDNFGVVVDNDLLIISGGIDTESDENMVSFE